VKVRWCSARRWTAAVLLTFGMFWGDACLAVQTVSVPLVPEFDRFGGQIETVQAYELDGVPRYMFGIYDTGASVITISATEQMFFEPPIPVKVPGGATADGIGGRLTGDVSYPGTIKADGLHAFQIDLSLPDLYTINLGQAAVVPGVQAFLGTTDGSPILPTITGTPIHLPSPAYPSGVAAKVDMLGYELDFGAMFPGAGFDDLVLALPDVSFVAPGTQLTAGAGTTGVVARVPLAFFGESNHPNPGDQVTAAPNPVQANVTLRNGMATIGGKTLLFDTGAQMSIISSEIAEQLGLDLDNPEDVVEVLGAAGQVGSVPGFTISALELPCDAQDDTTVQYTDTLQFTSVPVYVLDLNVEGLDGILGMNLLNPAAGLLYDPTNPADPFVSMTFLENMDYGQWGEEAAGLGFLSALGFSAFGGAMINPDLPHAPGVQSTAVPEPATLVLLGTAGLPWLGWRTLRRRLRNWRARLPTQH